MINISNNQHIKQHCKQGIVTLLDVVIFTNTKKTYWKHPTDINYLPENLGLKCTSETNLYALDVDHLHEHEEAEKAFNTIVEKYFLGAIPSFNINPKKYKLIFRITDGNQDILRKYNIKDGFDVVGFDDKAIEFFGAQFKNQCIKTHGEYWKELDKVTEADKAKIIKTKGTLAHLGYYTDNFSIIEITSSEFCNFIDEVLATNLFVVRTTSTKKRKTKQELQTSYDDLTSNVKERLDTLAFANAHKSNSEYLDACYPFIKWCIEENKTLDECIFYMELALNKRGVADKIKNFTKEAEKEYKKAKYFTKKSFNHALLAEDLIKEHQLTRHDNNIYYWNGTKYCSDFEVFITGVIQNLLPQLKKNQKQEVIYHIKHSFNLKNIKHADVNYIAFKNGVLNIENGQFIEPNNNFFITNIIPHNYNQLAFDSVVDSVLWQWSCNDESIRNVLLECAGYCLYRNCKFKKGFILYGEKNNGKSSYIDLLVNMLGQDNITSHDLKDLTNQFYRVTIKDKLANIGDDIQKSFSDSSDFKKIVSGDLISAKASHKDPIDFKPYCKLIFSCNDYPKLSDNTGAVHNRLISIPFNADFSKNPDKSLRTHLKSENAIEYFIILAIKGLQRLLQNDNFTVSDAIERERTKFRIENNSILSFIEERKEIDGNIPIFERENVDTCYRYYDNFCSDNNLKPFGNIEFSRKICQELNYKVKRVMINGQNLKRFSK